jgi:hypothetical protein
MSVRSGVTYLCLREEEVDGRGLNRDPYAVNDMIAPANTVERDGIGMC